MAEERDLYEAQFDENDTEGVFSISLVEKPATTEYFLAMSEDKKLKYQEIQFKSIDTEKRILMGLVLEPNEPVYRKENGYEFDVFFSENTIRDLSYNFFKKDFHKNSTLEHNKDNTLSGVTFTESWIVADPKNDKSSALGFEYAKGSWCVVMKVDSDEIWNDYVKTGKVKGFSIDGVVKLKKTDKSKTNIAMSTLVEKLTIATDKIVLALSKKEEPKKAELKFGTIEMEGGEVIFEYEGEVLEAGVSIFAVDPTDAEAKIPVPEGKYPLEDGTTLIVTEEGVVGEIIAKEDENSDTAGEEVATAEEEVAASTGTEGQQKISSILIKYNETMKFDERLKGIETQLTSILAMKTEVEGIKKDVLEFGEQPRTAPKGAPRTAPTTRKGRILQSVLDAKQQSA